MFRAPRGRTPALGSGQGVYRRDRATQITYIRNTCAPVPRPVSHLTAAAAAARDRCLRFTKAINIQFEITFVRSAILRFINPKVRPKVISDLVVTCFVLRVSPAQRRRPGRSNRPKIDSIIYSLGFGNRESRVDFFALSIPILSYNSCFRVSIFCPPNSRAGLVENMSYSLGLESKGRKNRLEILDFQILD